MKRILALVAGLVILAPLVAAQNQVVTLQTFDGEACPTESARYGIEIRNTGSVEDVYTVEADVAWSTISNRQITVQPGTSETSYLWLQPPKNMDPGTYSFTAKVTSTDTGETVRKQGSIRVLSCRSVDVHVDNPSRNVCRGDQATYNVEVENNGEVKETYRLTSDYGTLSRKRVTLDPDEDTTVRLTASSNKAMTRDIIVRAESTSSYASDESVLQFTAERCRSANVILSPSNQAVCNGETASLTATVENTGSVEDTYTLVTTGQLQGDSRVTLAPGESMTSPVTVSRQEGTHTVALQVDSTSLPSLSFSRDAKVTFEKCYGLKVTERPSRVGIGKSNRTLMTFYLRNTGTRTNTYDISLNGPEWVDVKPFKRTVDPGQREEAYMYVAPDFFADKGQYTATVTFTDDHGAVHQSYPVNITVDGKFISVEDDGEAKPGRNGLGKIFADRSNWVLAALFLALLIAGYLFFRRGNLPAGEGIDYEQAAEDYLDQNSNTVVKALREDTLSNDFLEVLLEEERQDKNRQAVLNQIRQEMEGGSTEES